MISAGLHVLEVVFGWLLQASWQASVLVLLVLLLQRLLRNKLNPRWHHALWLLIVARLLLPALPESALSLFQFAPPAPSVMTQAVAEPVFAAPIQSVSKVTPLPPELIPYRLTVFTVLALIWLAGATGLLLLTCQVNRRFVRHVSTARPINDPRLLQLAAMAQGELGIHRAVPMIESAQVESPAIMGLFRPTLILPGNVETRFNDEELRLIFLHEFAHLKRGDLLLQWLIALLQIVHWFNPVLWYAFRRMRADREPATDALVLSCTGGESKESYGQVLVKLLEHYHQRHALPTLVGILEDKEQFKRRFSLIAQFTRGGYGWSFLGVLLIGLLSVACLTKSKADGPIVTSSVPDPLATIPGFLHGEASETTIDKERELGTLEPFSLNRPAPNRYAWAESYEQKNASLSGAATAASESPATTSASLKDGGSASAGHRFPTVTISGTLQLRPRGQVDLAKSTGYLQDVDGGGSIPFHFQPDGSFSVPNVKPGVYNRQLHLVPANPALVSEATDAVLAPLTVDGSSAQVTTNLTRAVMFGEIPKGGIQVSFVLMEIGDDVYLANKVKIDTAVEKADLNFLFHMDGADLVSAPSVTTRPGVKATIGIVRKFPYPIAFDPSETVTQSAASVRGGKIANTNVIPPTPAEFATKDIGVTAELTPTINPANSPDPGKIVLTGKVSVTDFEGFTPSNFVKNEMPAFDTRESFFIEALDDHQTKALWIPGSRFDERLIMEKDSLGKLISQRKEAVKKRLLLLVTASVVK